jgi:hypothetical protein
VSVEAPAVDGLRADEPRELPRTSSVFFSISSSGIIVVICRLWSIFRITTTSQRVAASWNEHPVGPETPVCCDGEWLVNKYEHTALDAG